jgi:hypothetical protein
MGQFWSCLQPASEDRIPTVASHLKSFTHHTPTLCRSALVSSRLPGGWVHRMGIRRRRLGYAPVTEDFLNSVVACSESVTIAAGDDKVPPPNLWCGVSLSRF